MTQSFWFFGTHFTILADRTTTEGQYDLLEGYFLPGKQTPLHRHTRYAEHLYVLEGEVTIWAGENKVVLSTGDHFLVPAGIPHAVGILSDRPAHGLVVAAPSGFARLVAATGTSSQTETPDMDLFMQLCAEIGDEILAPPGTLPAA